MEKYTILVNNQQYGVAFGQLGEFKNRVISITPLDRYHRLIEFEIELWEINKLEREVDAKFFYLVEKARKILENEKN